MSCIDGELANRALECFVKTDFNDPAAGDTFFGTFGIGNTIDQPDKPFERFCYYEKLLVRLMNVDDAKYRKMHKGTAFGYLSWLAFDMRNYEKALFYMDSGIAEDVRKHKDTSNPAGWLNNPGPRFLMLDVDRGFGWFVRTEDEVKELLQQQLDRFNKISGRPALTTDSWRSFTKKLLVHSDATQRSIISALYVFLLEFRDHKQELLLRETSKVGSNQPFTVHLFTGGLIFESLLKHCYLKPAGGKKWTLGEIFNSPTFMQDFGKGCSGASLSAEALEDILNDHSGSSLEAAFMTTAKLRNTTGHNLVWDNIFDAPKNYIGLYEREMNAILHVIAKKLSDPSTLPAPAGTPGTVPIKVTLAPVTTSTGPGVTTSTSGPGIDIGGGGTSGTVPPNPGNK